MNSPFTIEPEFTADLETEEAEDAFEWEGESLSKEALGEAEGSFDEYETLLGEEFETQASASKTTAKRPGASSGCPGYESGEVQKSFTPQGHLPIDVINHARGTLIADFGVDRRTPRSSLKGEKALQEWLATIAQAIGSNPKVTIRILGFSDCVGKERHNRILRHGRATRVRDLLKLMVGSAQWNSIKSKIQLVDAAPAGVYAASNDTIEGRAQNRGVLLEHTRIADMEPLVVRQCLISPRQAATYPLLRLIPNDANYQKHVPLEYRLDAKKVIGAVAQDISKNGQKAHFAIEAVHWGIVAGEIFGLIGALGLVGGALLMVVGNFLALGIPCVEAAQEEAVRWARTGFSRGVVMGANRRSTKLLKDYFGNDYFRPNDFCPQARDVAIANYRMGLLVGYVNGRLLCPHQHVIFWRDLGRRMDYQARPGDQKNWGRREWLDWYITAAAIFSKHHLH